MLQADDKSIYQLHRKLIALRRQHPALQAGSYRPLAAEGDVLAFMREAGAERILVALNLGAQPTAVKLPDERKHGRLLLSAFCDRTDEHVTDSIYLRGNEGVVVALQPP